ncbi:unnamed protein product [Clonostachys rosea]|uniref:Uncharacterized protein n=1 Tax=Bionectria ochroleuca TaxID=29856 RepID=A0ABY6UDX4_BIOOC|nr:unnamed protein product [Clonostachys rosea]
MYHVAWPNPHEPMPAGQEYIDMKIGDGGKDRFDKYDTHGGSFSWAQSKGQVPSDNAKIHAWEHEAGIRQNGKKVKGKVAGKGGVPRPPPDIKQLIDTPEKFRTNRPGKVEEKAIFGENSKPPPGKNWTEKHRIRPKTQEEINAIHKEKNRPGEAPKAWTIQDLADNIALQQDHIKNHKAGENDSKFREATDQMLEYANHEPIAKTVPYERSLRRRIY